MAEQYDPLVDDIRETLREISADYAEAKAQYERAAINGDEETRRQALRQMGHYQTEYNNACNYGNQYWQSQHPPAPPEPTLEERRARPLHAMDWNDIVEMTRQSKYAKDIRPDDPNMLAGYQEAMRRRRAGE